MNLESCVSAGRESKTTARTCYGVRHSSVLLQERNNDWAVDIGQVSVVICFALPRFPGNIDVPSEKSLCPC